MLKLLIVSDSHRLKDDLVALFEKYKDYNIIHLGDYQIDEHILDKYNVIYVRGNCDFFSKAKKEMVLTLDDKTLFLTHGDLYNVKSSFNNIFYKALEVNANYCLFGHTHQKTKFIESDITFINPGSFKDEGSYVTINDDDIKFHFSR